MKFEEKIYNYSPIWMQNVLISLKGLELALKRVDKRESTAFLKFLLESQYWSKDQIADYQLKQLQRIIGDAFNYVPYYKKISIEYGLSIDDFKTIDDIKKLPLLDKKTVKNNPYDFLDVRYKNYRTAYTSGSTGSPMKIFSNNKLFSQKWAFELRLRVWAGLDNYYHPKRAQFTGRYFIPHKDSITSFSRYNLFQNTLHFSSDLITKESVKYYLNELNTFKPDFIDSFPSSLSIIAKICKEKNLKVFSPKAIRLTSETLFEEDRKIIEEVFNSKVYNQYGASEQTAYFCDNSKGELLVNPEYGYVEIIDSSNNIITSGEGEIVTTCLLNDNCMPLIRYKTGDIATIGDTVSTNEGRNFMRINEVIGRVDDTIYLKGVGNIQRFDFIFKDITDILEGQVALISSEFFEVLIVLADTKSEAQVKQKLKENIERKVGTKITFEIKVVDKIMKGANGKFKNIIDRTKSQTN